MTALGLGLGLPFGRQTSNPLYALGATFAMDARDSIANEQWVLNRGSGGQVLRAKYGSVARAEIRRGIGLVLPGTGTNNAAITGSTTYTPTTSMSARFAASHDTWSPSVTEFFGGVWTTGATRSWVMGVTSGKLIRTILSNDGTVNASDINSSNMSVNPGDILCVRSDWNVAGTLNVFYKTSTLATFNADLASDSGWLSVLSSSGATTSPLFQSTEAFRFGAHIGGGFTGTILGSNITVDGVNVIRTDFTTQPDLTTSFTATTGQTVTVTAANAVDTNDPTLLTHTGENYVYVTAGSTAGINSVLASPTITFGNVLRYEVDSEIDFSLAGQQNLMDVVGAANAGGVLFYAQGGQLLTSIRTSPGAFTSVLHGLSGVRREKLACEIDISLGTAKYFRWVAGAWAQLGATQSFAVNPWGAATSVNAYVIGSGVTATKLFEVKVINDGTTVVHWDFRKNTSQTSFTPDVGPLVAFNRGTAGRKTVVVTRPVWLFGTDDYLEVADNDLLDFNTQDHTIVAICRIYSTPINFGAILVKNGVAPYADSYALANNNGSGFAPRFYEEEAASLDTVGVDGASSSGQLTVLSGVRTSTLAQLYVNNTVTSSAATGVDDLRNTNPLRVGATSTSGFYNDMEIMAVGVFRRALSAAEIAQIVAYYGAA